MYLSPVFHGDVDKLKKEFFSIDFKNQNLGSDGVLMGTAARRLEAEGPLTPTQFSELLYSKWADPQCLIPNQFIDPLAWQVKLDVGESASALWAVGDIHTRHLIERMHGRAVGETAEWLEMNFLNSSLLFAAFQSGTGEHQTPLLHSDLFVFNHDFSSTRADLKLIAAAEKTILLNYFVRLDIQIHGQLGEIDRSDATYVPRGLFAEFKNNKKENKIFQGDKLFEAWSEESAAHGFGPNEASNLLKEALALKKVFKNRQRNERTPRNLRRTFSEWREKLKTLRKAKDRSKDKGPSHSY